MLKQGSGSLHRSLDDGSNLNRVLGGADYGAEVAIRISDALYLPALNAFDQHFNVAVGKFQALDNVNDGAHLIDLCGLGLIHGGVVLGGEKNLAVTGKRLFQRAHAGFPAHDKGSHHEREDHHIADRHHRQIAGFELFFFSGLRHSVSTLTLVSLINCPATRPFPGWRWKRHASPPFPWSLRILSPACGWADGTSGQA